MIIFQRNLEPNKAHGYDMPCIRMVKICHDFICKTLKLIFRSYLESGKLPSEWKKAKMVPFHKNSDKKYLKTTGQYHYFLYSGKFLRGCYMIDVFKHIFKFLKKII